MTGDRAAQLRGLIRIWERRVLTAPTVEDAAIAHAKLDKYRAALRAAEEGRDGG